MPLREPRILVSENDGPTMDLISSVLVDAGYQVTGAESLEQACSLLTTQRFTLVLTDSFSNHTDDILGATASLRQAAGATPVLLCTGHRVSQEDVQAAGLQDVIVKPFDIDTLVSKVRATLAGPHS